MATHPAQRNVRFRPMGLTRLSWRRHDSAREEREFEEAMRAAYDRLKADPVAWRDYMEELASIDPAIVDPADLA